MITILYRDIYAHGHFFWTIDLGLRIGHVAMGILYVKCVLSTSKKE